LFRGQLQLNEEGYIISNGHSETSVDNVFAIGDVSNPSRRRSAARPVLARRLQK